MTATTTPAGMPDVRTFWPSADTRPANRVMIEAYGQSCYQAGRAATVKDSLTVRQAEFDAWLDKPISGTTRRAYYSDNQLTAARDAWEAATAAEREDAQRYRWLRDRPRGSPGICIDMWDDDGCEQLSVEKADAAIDDARGESK